MKYGNIYVHVSHFISEQLTQASFIPDFRYSLCSFECYILCLTSWNGNPNVLWCAAIISACHRCVCLLNWKGMNSEIEWMFTVYRLVRTTLNSVLFFQNSLEWWLMAVGRNNTNDWHLMYRECTRKPYSVCKRFEIKWNAVSYIESPDLDMNIQLKWA